MCSVVYLTCGRVAVFLHETKLENQFRPKSKNTNCTDTSHQSDNYPTLDIGFLDFKLQLTQHDVIRVVNPEISGNFPRKISGHFWKFIPIFPEIPIGSY